MTKKISLSLIVLIVFGCVLLSAGLIIGVYFLFQSQKDYVPQTVKATEILPLGIQMDQVQQEVSSIRGLSPQTDLQRALMTTAELKDTVVNDFFKNYTPEESKQDSRLLSALGLLNTGFDLRQFYLDLYSEQIAGYYDSESKEMYVVSDEQFGGIERLTYSHEYTHVLQDQYYDLERGLKLNDKNCQVETEYCAALTALVEGDATLTEQFWFLKYSTDLDKKQVSQFQESYSSPVYDSAPDYMKKDFFFPYQEGFNFVNQLYQHQEWQSVDEAYLNPPVSTEQILHPEKYPSEKPVRVVLPDLLPNLGEGWSEIDRSVVGEWYSYLILSSGISPQMRLSENESKIAAAGWGGDTYAYFSSDSTDDYLFAWRITWDNDQDVREFFQAIRKYGIARWGGDYKENENTISWNTQNDGWITLRNSGQDVLWLMSNNDIAFKVALTTIADFGN
ncbi:MAG: hypothetical protein NTZ74_10335 [Chloroflexi bacterium]|nr:hypothetical protein [Chloroflexota bacterium]